MQHRRILIAPLVALVLVALVAAVIDAGQRTRMERGGLVSMQQADATARQEQYRIDALLASQSACVGERECAASNEGANICRSADEIASWPVDTRFNQSRRALHAMLLARATLVDQIAMSAIDGRTSPDEALRIEALHDAWVERALEEADTRRAAGLIDRSEHRHVRRELLLSSSVSGAPPRS